MFRKRLREAFNDLDALENKAEWVFLFIIGILFIGILAVGIVTLIVVADNGYFWQVMVGLTAAVMLWALAQGGGPNESS